MIRTATPDDAAAMCAIYAPIVASTTISFELEAPDEAEMRSRITTTLQRLPWLVWAGACWGADAQGAV